MKISQEVREYAKDTKQVAADQAISIKMLDDPLEGMKQKSAEFRATGSELYHPAVVAEQNGFAIDQVMLGVSSTSLFTINLADKQLVVGADFIGSDDSVSDYHLCYSNQKSLVAALD